MPTQSRPPLPWRIFNNGLNVKVETLPAETPPVSPRIRTENLPEYQPSVGRPKAHVDGKDAMSLVLPRHLNAFADDPSWTDYLQAPHDCLVQEVCSKIGL